VARIQSGEQSEQLRTIVKGDISSFRLVVWGIPLYFNHLKKEAKKL